MNNLDIIREANGKLDGQRILAIIVTVCLSLFNLLPHQAHEIGGLLITSIIMGPLTYGICNFFLKIVRNQKAQFEDLFSGFSFFFNNVI